MDELFVLSLRHFRCVRTAARTPHTVSPSHKRPNAAYIAILGVHASAMLGAPAAIRSA